MNRRSPGGKDFRIQGRRRGGGWFGDEDDGWTGGHALIRPDARAARVAIAEVPRSEAADAETRAAEAMELRPHYRDWLDRDPSFRPQPKNPDDDIDPGFTPRDPEQPDIDPDFTPPLPTQPSRRPPMDAPADDAGADDKIGITRELLDGFSRSFEDPPSRSPLRRAKEGWYFRTGDALRARWRFRTGGWRFGGRRLRSAHGSGRRWPPTSRTCWRPAQRIVPAQRTVTNGRSSTGRAAFTTRTGMWPRRFRAWIESHLSRRSRLGLLALTPAAAAGQHAADRAGP